MLLDPTEKHEPEDWRQFQHTENFTRNNGALLLLPFSQVLLVLVERQDPTFFNLGINSENPIFYTNQPFSVGTTWV